MNCFLKNKIKSDLWHDYLGEDGGQRTWLSCLGKRSTGWRPSSQDALFQHEELGSVDDQLYAAGMETIIVKNPDFGLIFQTLELKTMFSLNQ